MKTTSRSAAPTIEVTDDDIREYAYHLYEQSGRIPGRDLENWLEAKACVLANIPRRLSHTRLHHHLHDTSPVRPLHRGFTMPPSDAALVDESETVAPAPTPAHKRSPQPRDASGHFIRVSERRSEGGSS